MISASLDALATAQHDQPTEDPGHDQIEEANRHNPRSCTNLGIQPNRRSQPLRQILKQYRIVGEASNARLAGHGQIGP
jgi:hypothetical protein